MALMPQLSDIRGVSAPLAGEERLFLQDELRAARAWALGGGIAIVKQASDFRVLGRLGALQAWATACGVGVVDVRLGDRNLPPNVVLSGQAAVELDQYLSRGAR